MPSELGPFQPQQGQRTAGEGHQRPDLVAALDDVFLALTGHVAEEKVDDAVAVPGKRGRR